MNLTELVGECDRVLAAQACDVIKISESLRIQTQNFSSGCVTPSTITGSIEAVREGPHYVYARVNDVLFLHRPLRNLLGVTKSQIQGLTMVTLDNDRNGFPYDSSLLMPTMVRYALLTSAAVGSIDLEGKVVVELGTGEGGQSILAQKRGAKRVFGLDINPDAKGVFYRNIGINKVPREALVFMEWDIRDKLEGKRDTSPLYEAEVVISNIGPHYYPGTEEATVAWLDNLPKAKVFVGGGYVRSKDRDNGRSSKVYKLLRVRGFREVTEILDVSEKDVDFKRMAFIARKN